MSRVDIVVPCYNYGRYLRQCVESVLCQSHGDLRLLVIDDASTDETPAVARALMARDARVEVRRHSVNCGHIATYNEGIDWARSDYMLILSADDFLLPGAIERAVAVLDAQPEVGLTFGDWMSCGESAEQPCDVHHVEEARLGRLDAETFIEGLAARNFIATGTAFVRTSVQKRVGGYRSDLPHAGDLEMWLRFALHSKAVFIDAAQAVYRQHGANMSRGYDALADIEQCRHAFRLHYGVIRNRFENGPLIETRIAWTFAARALGQAVAALARREVAASCSLAWWSARERVRLRLSKGRRPPRATLKPSPT